MAQIVGETGRQCGLAECLIVGVYDLGCGWAGWWHQGDHLVEISGLRDSEIEHLGYSAQRDQD